MCGKPVHTLEQRCPTCQADLSLITEYVKDLQTGIDLADQHTKAGRLGEAVWTYLEVLEIDPDNAVARKQVGRVATAVRQFDNASPGRRWKRGLTQRSFLARWISGLDEEGGWGWLFWVFLIVLAVVLGYFLGQYAGPPPQPAKAASVTPSTLPPASCVSQIG